MAKFLPLLGSLSGSIGDNTFSNNKGGPYVRRRSNPTNPTSARQTAARAILATVSAAWAAQTSGNRQAWADYAALNPFTDPLGTTFQLSGQQMFCALNARLLQAGTTIVSTPPIASTLAAFTTLTPTLTAPATISIVHAATPLGAAERMQLWMCLPSTAGRDPNFKQARLVGYSAAANASPAAFTSPFPFATGQVVNLWVAKMDGAGRTTPVQKLRVTVP